MFVKRKYIQKIDLSIVPSYQQCQAPKRKKCQVRHGTIEERKMIGSNRVKLRKLKRICKIN